MFVIHNLDFRIIMLALSWLVITYAIVTGAVAIVAVRMVRDFKQHLKTNGGFVPISFVILAVFMTLSWTIFTIILLDFPEIYMLIRH